MTEVTGTVGAGAGVRVSLTLSLMHDITLNADSKQVTALSPQITDPLELKQPECFFSIF